MVEYKNIHVKKLAVNWILVIFVAVIQLNLIVLLDNLEQEYVCTSNL